MKNNTEHSRYEVGEWREDREHPWWAKVYIGGNFQAAEMVCRDFCFPFGLCVTIEETKFIFGGGTEEGVVIGLIQYPPFPEEEESLERKAVEIGQKIAEASFQWSFTVVSPGGNIFCSRRRK